MHLDAAPVVQVNEYRATVLARINAWALEGGFQVVTANATERLVFERGSSWSAMWTFDIRKIPTRVEISIVGDGPCTLYIKFAVSSGWQATSARDRTNFEEQVNLLVAKAKGAI